ncbi:hypothetical protein QE152_g8567 [Popillia japonica]|uniref:Uncharacterized protein n=1 Tax=Popillia japonica TaxID=7064 RepID=A0AAW1LXH8_POPJA
MWLGASYFALAWGGDNGIVTLSFGVSGIMLLTSALEVFGTCIENKWLVLPWLVVYGLLIGIIPILLCVAAFFYLPMIFLFIIYFIYICLYSVVYSYYKELCQEENEPNVYLNKLCAPLYLFDVSYLFERLYKAWCSARSSQEVPPDISERNEEEIVQYMQRQS